MADVILGERSRAVTVGRSHFATADDEESLVSRKDVA